MPIALFLVFASGCSAEVPAAVSLTPTKPETVLILPMAFGVEMSADSMKLNALLARAGLLKAFEERSVNVLTSAMSDSYGKQHKLAIEDPVNWTRENFIAMGKQLRPSLIASIKLVNIESVEGNVAGANGVIAPGSQLTTTATFEVSLFDVRSGKYILEKSKASNKRTVGRPGPSERQLAQEQNSVILEGAATGFEGFLKKRPLVKPKKAKSPVPDSSGG